MEGAQRVPYSRRALENLAMALRVDSAVIWFNPTTSRVDLINTHQDEDHDEWSEDEE
jgi:hypothetical protein